MGRRLFPGRGRPPYPGTFTPAEQRILGLLREQLTNIEIAERTGLSVNTVHTHIANMLSKTGTGSRRELAAWTPGEPAKLMLLSTPFAIMVGKTVALLAVGAGVVVGVTAVGLWAASGRGGSAPAAGTTTASSWSAISMVTATETPTAMPVTRAELLQRPLTLPHVAQGQQCLEQDAAGPVTFRGLDVTRYAGFFTTADDLVGAWAGWAEAKTIIVIGAAYDGPVLLRGGRIDGAGQLMFSAYGIPPAAATFITTGPRNADGTYSDVRGTLVSAAGCYAIQVDGAGFTEIVVFDVPTFATPQPQT